ncbi:hypothetical protein D3C87_1802280 [compost metagenome]
MEAALRSATSRSGNSSCASLEAEYTLAPASLTMRYASPGSPISAITSAVNCSVSREPVPLPITMSWMPYLAISSLNFAAASFFLLFGGVG